jgi:hypothetical protein
VHGVGAAIAATAQKAPTRHGVAEAAPAAVNEPIGAGTWHADDEPAGQ